MPQMSPMNWYFLMLIMMIFMFIMFTSSKNKLFYNKNLKTNKTLNMMSKKWHW